MQLHSILNHKSIGKLLCIKRKLNSFTLYLQIILIFCIFSQCRSDNSLKNYPVNKIKFSIEKTVNLPLDSLSQPFLSYIQVIEEDTLKLIFYNKFNQSLYVYDFRNEKPIEKLPVSFPMGELPVITAFYYINRDSILLFPEYKDFYYVCNEKGEINASRIKFVDEDDQDKIVNHWVTSSNPIIKLDNDIYINNGFGWVAKEGDHDKFLVIKHNILTKSSEFFIQHPSSIYDKNFDNSTFRHLVFTLNENHQSLLFSFNFDQNVYEYDPQKNKIVSYYCSPQNYVLPDALKKGMSSEDIWIHFQTNFSFSRLEFDPFRNVLLRMALQPYNIDDIKAGIINPENPKKPKIYVFDADKNYRLLGEIMLDEESNYYFINMFATEEGLWIQKIVDNEDIMCFELITYEL